MDNRRLEEDAAENVGQNKLGEVGKLAKMLADAERDVKNVENDLREKKEIARRLREETLPEAMLEVGLKSVELDDGTKVGVKDAYYATITDEKREAALNWLKANGFGGLIKSEIIASFGKEEVAVMEALSKKMTEDGINHEDRQNVHSSTLKAWVKERFEKGAPWPSELFGAIRVKEAKVEFHKPKFKLEE